MCNCYTVIIYSKISSATAEQKRQKVDFMRSLKICSAVIYFMAKGEKLTRRQVFGNQGNPVYAIWPVGRQWDVSYHDGKRWVSLSFLPRNSERDAYDSVIGHYYKNF